MNPNTGGVDRRHLALTLAGLMLGVLMSALDNTVIATAMPALVRDLGGLDRYSWPFTAYLLASALAVPILGRLADSIGRRTVFAAGLAEFMLASALCGQSGDMNALILWRGLQGMGGGVVVAGAFSIVGELAPPDKRGPYIGLVAAMFGVSSILGPSLGGFLTESLGWRWNFYINLPLGLLSLGILLAGMAGVKESRRRPRVDWLGSLCFAGAIVPLMLALARGGRDWPWLSAPSLGLFGLALALGAAFVAAERRAAEPIMPPQLFGDREFVAASLSTFWSNAVFYAAILFLPLYLQEVLQVSVLGSGMLLTPLLLGYSAASVASGGAIGRLRAYRGLSIGGSALALAGIAALAAVPAAWGQTPVLAASALLGVGLGLTVPVGNIAGQNSFGVGRIATVTATVQLARTVGGAVGAAVCGGLLNARLADGLAALDWGAAPVALKSALSDPQTLVNPGVLARIAAETPPAYREAFGRLRAQLETQLAAALHLAFAAAAVLALLALAASLLYRRGLRLAARPAEREPRGGRREAWVE